jgi:acetoacetyl-CoA synthetase
MSADSGRGRVLYQPSEDAIAAARLTHYCEFLRRTKGLSLEDYAALHAWSTRDLAAFWASVAEYFDVQLHTPAQHVLVGADLSGARWFTGATLNYAEQALRWPDTLIAVVATNEQGERTQLTFAELREQVRRCQLGLARLGVKAGDRVAAVLPNGIEALVALLATASLGAIWSSCAPEFGEQAIVDRFVQIEPKVLLAVDAYTYGGKCFERGALLERVRQALPGLSAMVLVHRSTLPAGTHDLTFEQLLANEADGSRLAFEAVPFEHPLWILYSSGTTGVPKAIVHGHGGIVLEHLKVLALHHNLGPGERFFWYSTTGWMMWNYLIGGLLVGATVVLHDGSPALAGLTALWQLAEREELTYFGASAAFILACRERGLVPRQLADLGSLRGVGSTGAPLSELGFEWVYSAVGDQVHLGSVSGGTDLCTAFVLCCPWLAVRSGELQCSALGADVQAFSPDGRRLSEQTGELVIARPMPSMPLALWADPARRRLRSSYFERYPGVWHHGDWILQHADGAAVISGRSDATLNRGGVRMGSAEFYRVLDGVAALQDSLVVERSVAGEGSQLWLFVQLGADVTWNEELSKQLKRHLSAELSPRHVPDVICPVPQIPYTLSGKKLEVPVKRLLEGAGVDEVASAGALRNPEALRQLSEASARLIPKQP